LLKFVYTGVQSGRFWLGWGYEWVGGGQNLGGWSFSLSGQKSV